MNQWGAVKLGLAVATVGTLGAAFGPGRTHPAQTAPRAGHFMLMAPLSSMISGAANELDGASGGGAGGVQFMKAAASRGSNLQQAPGAPAATGERIRKIVRTASLCFEVKDQSKARALVRAVIFRNGAEVFSDESAGDGDNQSGVIVIQTPPEKLDAILRELEPLGKAVSRSVSAENMSEEYVDLKSRLENYRKVERRLTELMQFRTNKLADVLQLERELERVGEQIEQTVGRMKYIDTLAASSRITVRLQQPSLVEAAQTPGILTQVRNSVVASFNTFVQTGLSLLSMTGFVLAIALWTLPVAGALWLIKRKLMP